MGTYYIPRNLRGETRIFYIFTVKSLISTVIGTMMGLVFLFIFSIIGLQMVGIIITAIFALVGWGIGAIKIPTIAGIQVTKKIGGEPLSEIILRWIKFNKNKKLYVYTKEENK
ncbi:MAG: PrgI family protein [Clostridia bacterium]|nr:PrgI family protein [Clostridia bacterium]